MITVAPSRILLEAYEILELELARLERLEAGISPDDLALHLLILALEPIDAAVYFDTSNARDHRATAAHMEFLRLAYRVKRSVEGNAGGAGPARASAAPGPAAHDVCIRLIVLMTRRAIRPERFCATDHQSAHSIEVEPLADLPRRLRRIPSERDGFDEALRDDLPAVSRQFIEK